MKVSGKSHSAERPEESFKLAKRFVFSKKCGAQMKKNKEEVAMKNIDLWRKINKIQNADVDCWA